LRPNVSSAATGNTDLFAKENGIPSLTKYYLGHRNKWQVLLSSGFSFVHKYTDTRISRPHTVVRFVAISDAFSVAA